MRGLGPGSNQSARRGGLSYDPNKTEDGFTTRPVGLNNPSSLKLYDAAAFWRWLTTDQRVRSTSGRNLAFWSAMH